MRNPSWKRLWCLAAVLTLLTGCGGDGAAALPENYALGQETLPALGEEEGVTSDAGISCTVTTDEETGATTYAYTGLSSGMETAQAYLQTLETDGCSAIDENGVRQEDAAITEEEGQVRMGRDAADGAGILEIEIQWSAESCQLTATVLEGKKIQEPSEDPEPIGVTEAVRRLETMPPEELGQAAGETYTAYADDGYIMVDEDLCYRLNLYDRTKVDTPNIVGTYLMSLDGERLYRVDRETGEAVELTQAS